MGSPRLRRALDHLKLIERRARGQQPGDTALDRLQLDRFARSPRAWLLNTAGKLAVVFGLAAVLAGLFAAGNVLMRAMGVQH